MHAKDVGKKYLLIVTVIILLLSIAPFQKASATNIAGYIFESTSSKVLINFFANYTYYSRNIPFKYTHEAEALDTVRETLVNQNEIQDIPILITLPYPFSQGFPEHTQLSLLNEGCSTDLGESVGEPRILGACYQIYVVEQPSHKNLLPLMLALQKLTPTNQQIEVLNLEELNQTLSQEISQFQNITLHLNPVSSPDGRLKVSTVWMDGDVRFELLNFASSMTQTLEALKDYMVIEPVWSTDSRYIVYASLNEIKVFDTTTNSVETISLNLLIEGARTETLVAFDTSSNKLAFSGDTNLLASYNIYTYDLSSKEITTIAQDTGRPDWNKFFDPSVYEQTPQKTTPPDPQPFQREHVDYVDTTAAFIDWVKVISAIFVVSGLGIWLIVRRRKKTKS